jgi:protocatechuate 3,4-dioxygenase, beta subunit
MDKRIINGAGQLLSRRTFAGAGLASAGLLWAAGAGAVERVVTAESPMGPFFPLTPPADSDADLTWMKGHAKRASGQVIELSGRVFDIKGNPIGNASLDLWQANAAGRYAHPNDISAAPLDPDFQGFASIRTDAAGAWRLTTIKPGGYDSPIGHRPPHIHFDIRGQRHRNLAQLYFPEEAPANAADTLYKALGAEAGTSVAARDSADANKYVWDIVLLG